MSLGERQRERERDRQTDRQTETDRDRETDRERQRERETDRDRERQREQGLGCVSLHNNISPPEREINPLKAACGCPCGGVIENGHTRNPLSPWKAFVSVQLRISGEPRGDQQGNAATTATTHGIGITPTMH